MKKLNGKVAIVSGSGRGIGREIALKLASEGARVVVNDLDEGPAQETVDMLNKAGCEGVACVGSVTDRDFAERFVRKAIDAFGGLDIVVNNAGYTWDSVIQRMTDEQWSAMLDVHLTAPFRIMRAASEYLRKTAKTEDAAGVENFRKVVNVSSISGVMGNAGQANYSAAKAGLIGLTKAMSKEWGRYKVNVNSVAYGLIHTRLTNAVAGSGASISVAGNDIQVGISSQLMGQLESSIPLGRAGTPQEAAGAIYLLCIPESDYISGQVLLCTGGM